MMRLLVLLSAIALTALSSVAMAASEAGPIRNIVLVHGAFADGSGWKAVAEILEKDGYKVAVVQIPETSLEADVAATKLVLDRQPPGPIVLVGHSYGGAVITVAGNHPNVVSLVYAAAFAPDEGQTLEALNKSHPSLAGKDIMPDHGFLFVDPARFPQDFAAGVPLELAKFMAISQVPESLSSTAVPFPAPAWKGRPTYGIVATEDHMINPDLERLMYKKANAKITEVKSSHAVYIAHPRAVAEVIEEAARNSKQK